MSKTDPSRSTVLKGRRLLECLILINAWRSLLHGRYAQMLPIDKHTTSILVEVSRQPTELWLAP